MRIVEQREGHLVLRHRPWVAWAGGIVALCVGAVIAFSPWLSPALFCDRATCTLRTTPFAERTFPGAQLSAQAEQSTQRPRMGRLVVHIGDERVVFDLRYETMTVVNGLVERIHAYAAHPEAGLLIGERGDLRHALVLLGVALMIGFVTTAGARGRTIRFDAGRGTLTIGKKTLPLSEARRVVLTSEGPLRKLALELGNGESIALGESIATNAAFKELEAAVRRFVP